MPQQKYSEIFEKIFNYTRTICHIIGLDVIRTDYKFNWRTMCVFILINSGISVCLYTIYVDTVLKGSYYYLFKTGAIIGTAIQGYGKAVNGLVMQSEMRYLHKEIKEMYEIYELKSSIYRNVLKDSISLFKKILIITFAVITFTCFVILVPPIIRIVFFNTREEILPYMVPFLDFETDMGYFVTVSSHIVCVFVASYGNYVSDTWLFVYAAHVPLMKNIFKCKFDELDQIINTNPHDAKKSSGQLLEILKWHQKYNVFCASIKKTFFWVIFLQISTEFFGIACCIVCIFLGVWPPAPVYAIYLYTVMFSYCSVGNLVEIANDDITTIIYDSCWYNLTVPEQKMILIMLRKSQEDSSLSIGGVSPLSLNTALQLTKTIYTFSMMLKEYFG